MNNINEHITILFFNPHLSTCLLILEIEEGRETDRQTDRHQCERETLIGWLPYVLQLGIEPKIRVCASTCNGTWNFLMYGLMLHSPEFHQPEKTQSFFSSVLFNLHIFVDFFTSFLQLISDFKALCSGNMLGIISVFLNVFSLVLWPNIWSILENFPCTLEKNVWPDVLGWKAL